MSIIHILITSTQDVPESVDNICAFIRARLTRVARKENLSGWRRCSGERPFRGLFYTLESEEVAEGGYGHWWWVQGVGESGAGKPPGLDTE